MLKKINKKRKKSSAFIVVVLSIIFGGLIMDGCMGLNSRESFTQKVLKKEYGEDFVVHEINNRGSNTWSAIVSPQNTPECLFEVIVNSDGSIANGSYCNAYASYLMTCILRKDLEQFFPSAYIRMGSLSKPMDDSIDFINMPLDKIIDRSNQLYPGPAPSGEYYGYLYIYIDSEVGSTKQYEEEYLYFTDKIYEYVSENKMVPLAVDFCLVDKKTMDRVREYYLEDLDFDSHFQNDVRGSVSEMTSCFIKTMPGFVSKEEYIQRRREFENGR